MSDLKDIDDVQDELLQDKPLLLLRDGDTVELMPLTPCIEEPSRFNKDISQYRIAVYVPKSDTLRQFILSKGRFMRLNNLVGNWTDNDNACIVRITRSGAGVSAEYKFELVQIGSQCIPDRDNALERLAALSDEPNWEDFAVYAQEIIGMPEIKSEIEKEKKKDTKDK